MPTPTEWEELYLTREVDTKKYRFPLDSYLTSYIIFAFSFFVWAATDTVATDEIVQRQLQAVIDTNMPVFEAETDKLAASQVSMLRAVANGEQRLNSAEVVKKYNLGGPQTITRNKSVLMRADILEKQDGRLVFVDPLYRLWFKRTFY